MMSRGVEISIAGGVVAMVRGLSLGQNQAPYICIFPHPYPWSLITSPHVTPMTHSES